MKINTSGRTDIEAFFEKSDIRYYKDLGHTPALVFNVEGDTVHVIIVNNPSELLLYPDSTKVMMQWKGQWRSDFFQFTVGEYREHLNKRETT